MATTNVSLPGPARQMVRDAVRKHPDLQAHLPLGSKVNDLPKRQLLLVAEALNIDVAAVIHGATAPTPPLDLPETDDTDGPAPETPEAPDENLAADALTLRRELALAMVDGDFDAVTTRIRDLLADARKPPVIEYVRIEAPATSPDGQTAPVPAPRAARVDTWGALFGLSAPFKARKLNVYAPGPLTPAVDRKYIWNEDVLVAALCALSRGRNIWLYGPAGTGKSTFAEQLAARTGRPFILIPCDDTTEAPELVGMTTPHDGRVRWQDGVLTAAMRTPNAIVLIDEPTVARAGALMVLQSVLASGVLSIKETGEAVCCAEGVRFIVADNTNGTGGGTAEGYEGTRRLNRATLDRFATFLRMDYLDETSEATALVSHTGCTPELAHVLVGCAALTRKARVTHAIGLRRLIAWAECLTDGVAVRQAFEYAVLNSCARDDREPTEQCCALGLDKKAIAGALAGRAHKATPPISPAARDFTDGQEG